MTLNELLPPELHWPLIPVASVRVEAPDFMERIAPFKFDAVTPGEVVSFYLIGWDKGERTFSLVYLGDEQWRLEDSYLFTANEHGDIPFTRDRSYHPTRLKDIMRGGRWCPKWK